MCSWSKTQEDVNQLVDSFFVNDPYYPRPRPQDSLYQAFCTGYMRAHVNNSDEACKLGEAFLRSIEAEQAKRDSARGQYSI